MWCIPHPFAEYLLWPVSPCWGCRGKWMDKSLPSMHLYPSPGILQPPLCLLLTPNTHRQAWQYEVENKEMHFLRDKFKGVAGPDWFVLRSLHGVKCSFLKECFLLLEKFPAQSLGRRSHISEGSLEKPDFQQQCKPDSFALKETGEKGEVRVQNHCFVSLEWG